MRWCNAVVFSLFLAAGAAAQDYPARPVTIVVPQAAGGANDILGRIVAQQLSQSLGQQFAVENRALGKGLANAEVRERFAAQGAEVVGAGPEALAAALREDVVKWGRVVKAAGIKID